MFTKFYQNVSRNFSYFDNNTSTDCQKWVLYVWSNFFMETFFALKIISSWITFSEMERFVFVKISEKIVLSLKSFNRIVKTGLHKSGEICQCKRFFLVKSIFSRLFLDIGQMFSELWKQIVKIVSLSVQINFSEKKFFPGKLFSLETFFRTGGGVGERFFVEIFGKNGFLAENCQERCQNGTQRFQSYFLR